MVTDAPLWVQRSKIVKQIIILNSLWLILMDIMIGCIIFASYIMEWYHIFINKCEHVETHYLPYWRSLLWERLPYDKQIHIECI